jgi:hypothetical protein
MQTSLRYTLHGLVLAACFVIPCLAGAASPKAEPRIAIDAPVFDFKEVREGTAVEHAFRVVNTGAAELKIRRIKTS